jgi:zinc protease
MIKKVAAFTAACVLLMQGYAQKSLPQNFFLKKLPNGLEILVIEDNTVPLATIEIAAKNGAYTESPEYNGLSHLYEHMFFKANKDYPSQEAFLERVQELGIVFNGTTSNERVNYFFTLPKFNLTAGLQFMNSAIRYPKFDSTEMKKENIVVDGEFQRQESNPFFALSDSVNHHLWGELYSRKNGIGDHGIIRSATPAKMLTIKNKYYWPNNSLLSVAGDVKHEDVFAHVEKILGSWEPAGFDPFKKWPVPEFKPLVKNDYIIVESKIARVPIAAFSWLGPDTRNDVASTYAADLFSTILSQNASKFNKALVDSGLAYQAGLSYVTSKHTGPIQLFAVPNPAKVKECVAEVKRQIDMMDAADYFTDDQIATAKRQLEIDRTKEQEATSSYVHTVSYWWCSATLNYYANYLENIKKLTRADLQNYVRKYIKGKPYVAGLLINTGMVAKVKPAEFFKAD